jgi:hypothetical protein
LRQLEKTLEKLSKACEGAWPQIAPLLTPFKDKQGCVRTAKQHLSIARNNAIIYCQILTARGAEQLPG